MSRALLDSNSGDWAALIPHGDRRRLAKDIPPGLHFAQLHPHKADNGVSATIDGVTVGHLGADLLHYHRPLARAVAAGVEVFAECRLGTLGGREGLLIPRFGPREIEKWAARQIGAHRRCVSEHRRRAARAHRAQPLAKV